MKVINYDKPHRDNNITIFENIIIMCSVFMVMIVH